MMKTVLDLKELLRDIAIHRPDHRDTLGQTADYIKDFLTTWNIPFTVQEFALRPYMQLIIGISLVIIAIVFFVLIWKKKPIFALIVVLLIPTILILEFELFTPVVSRIITKPAENIIVQFENPEPVRELIFMAHYDSKTDFWDHIQRANVYKWILHVFVLGLLLSIWVLFVKRYDSLKNIFVSIITLTITGLFVVYWSLVALGFGGFIFLSEERESFGAVDNATAVVTLMAMAKDIRDGKVDIGNSRVTIIFTAGEEVTLQGADWYVKERWGKDEEPDIPTYLVNLELVAQNGNMVYWERVGVFLKYLDADKELIERLNEVWIDISGKEMDTVDKLTDDSHRFMSAGIPSITVGNSGLPGMGMGGFHSQHDNLDRVNYENLDLMIETLERYIESYNES